MSGRLPSPSRAAATVDGSLCQACGKAGLDVFYQAERIPVHSMLLLPTAEEAKGYAKCDLRLGFCASCGFIQNTAFDASVHEYGTKCEESQGFSPTFNEFAKALVSRLIERYDLRGKDVLEIGCGKGDFLALLCEMGGNRGTGVDPGLVPDRISGEAASRIRFVQDFYSEKYSELTGDMVACRHTLEHIQPVRGFVEMVKRSLGGSREKIVFFEVPDVERVLREQAFWDIYYEHCSYFSLGTLARLFRSLGFEVLDLRKDFGDQYLLIETRLAAGSRADAGSGGARFPGEDDLAPLAEAVAVFRDSVRNKMSYWRAKLERIRKEKRRAIAWGSGSKAVSFLTTLHAGDEIAHVVDINPHRQGWHIPGTGHRIVSPGVLAEFRPEFVIVMNPLYEEEIRRDLGAMGLAPQVESV